MCDVKPGTRVTVLSTKQIGAVKGTDRHGRVAVDVGGAVTKHATADLELYEERPRELRAAEARAMASAAFDFDDHRPKQRRIKKHRAVRMAEKLTDAQLTVLVRLLEGDAVLCTVGGRSYAVDRVPIGWWVCGLDADSEEHTVLEDLSACSCQDSKFRGRRCKHLEAVTRATTVA